MQSPVSHLQGHGCPDCGKQSTKILNKLSQTEFIDKLQVIFNNCNYDFSLTIYKGSNQFVDIICPKHGIFKKLAHSLLYRQSGCPYCSMSAGELKIRNLLIEKNISFKYQHHFKNCRGTRNTMPFDFYLPDYNMCIEFDGKQHYESVSIFGGEKAFKEIQTSDRIKDKYCKRVGIKLLRIPYWNFRRIEKIIDKNIVIGGTNINIDDKSIEG